jgi:hypothetical protein
MNPSNIPVPPLDELVYTLRVCSCTAKLGIFKVVHNKVIEGWKMEAGMLRPPLMRAVQCKNKLGQKTSDKKINQSRYWHTCVAVYAIEHGVTCPFSPSILATSHRPLVISLRFLFEAKEGDVNMCWYAWSKIVRSGHQHGEECKRLTHRRRGPFRNPISGDSGSPSSFSYKQQRKTLEDMS